VNNFELEDYLNRYLHITQYQDYTLNGLQIEGRPHVEKIICGVTASLALIEHAITEKTDAILVHHGYFWKGESPAITAIKKRRIKALLQNDINLYGYHLPLDGHTEVGNNALLAKLWRVEQAAPIAACDLVWSGEVDDLSCDDLSAVLSRSLQRQPLVIKGGKHRIRRLAWCSGAAQDYLEKAVRSGADAFISGEISERTYHEAKEYGIHYFAAGHHATERYGIQALGEHIRENIGIEYQFIDCPNPV